MKKWVVANTPKFLPELPKESENIINAWREPTADSFFVRDAHYFEDKHKVPSESSLYRCIGMHVFKRSRNMFPAAENINCLKAFLDDNINEQDLEGIPRYLIVCWQFHNFFRTEYWCAVQLFELREELQEDSSVYRTLNRFIASTDDERNLKLKFMAHIREANSAVKRSVQLLGGERPAIIGKKLATGYKSGKGYLEIDMDVGSSNIASSLNGVVTRASQSLVVDKCWLIEAQAEDELPERLLCCCEWYHCSVEDISLDIDNDGNLKKGIRVKTRSSSAPQIHHVEAKLERMESELTAISSARDDATINEVITDEENDYYDSFPTVNDGDFMVAEPTVPRLGRSQLLALKELSKQFTSIDVAMEPLEGTFSGYLDMKSYDSGRHRWHRRLFTLQWKGDDAAVLSYSKEKDSFSHTLTLKSTYRVESRSMLFGGSFAFAVIDDTADGPQTKVLLRARTAEELRDWLIQFLAALTASERALNRTLDENIQFENGSKIDMHLIRRSKRRSSIKSALGWLRLKT